MEDGDEVARQRDCFLGFDACWNLGAVQKMLGMGRGREYLAEEVLRVRDVLLVCLLLLLAEAEAEDLGKLANLTGYKERR